MRVVAVTFNIVKQVRNFHIIQFKYIKGLRIRM